MLQHRMIVRVTQRWSIPSKRFLSAAELVAPHEHSRQFRNLMYYIDAAMSVRR